MAAVPAASRFTKKSVLSNKDFLCIQSRPALLNIVRHLNKNAGGGLLSLKTLATLQVARTNPEVKVDPPYVTHRGGEKSALDDKTPKPRYLWKEFADQGFPTSPAEATTDLYTFLEQQDIYRRRSKLDIPDFCPGSIVAVTRADPYASKGTARFVGICIMKKQWDNRIGSSFSLRNVVDGEPMEMVFMTHSPLIHKIEVLRHQTYDGFNFLRLRDYPREDSFVPENMEAEKYSDIPQQQVLKPGHVQRLNAWFKSIFKAKSRFK